MIRTMNKLNAVLIIVLVIAGWSQMAEAAKGKKAKSPARVPETITLTAKTNLNKVLRDSKPNPDGSIHGWLTKRVIVTQAVEVKTHKNGKIKVAPNGWAVKNGSEVTIRLRAAQKVESQPVTCGDQDAALSLGIGFDPEKIFRPGWRFLPDHGCWIGVITQDGSFDIKQLTIIDRTDKNRTLKGHEQLQAGHEYKIFPKLVVSATPIKSESQPVPAKPDLPIMTRTGSLIKFSHLGTYQTKIVSSADLVTVEDLCLITTLAVEKARNSYYIPCPERDLQVPAGAIVIVNDVIDTLAKHRGDVRTWQAQPGQIVKSQNLRSLEIYFSESESLLADNSMPEPLAVASVPSAPQSGSLAPTVVPETTLVAAFSDDGGELGIDASRTDDLNGLFEVTAPNAKGFYIANSKNPEIKQKLLRACINLPEGRVISVKVRNQPSLHYYSDLFELKSVLDELGCELDDIQNIRIPAPNPS